MRASLYDVTVLVNLIKKNRVYFKQDYLVIRQARMTEKLMHAPRHFLSTHVTSYLLRAREIGPPECVTLQRSYQIFLS